MRNIDRAYCLLNFIDVLIRWYSVRRKLLFRAGFSSLRSSMKRSCLIMYAIFTYLNISLWRFINYLDLEIYESDNWSVPNNNFSFVLIHRVELWYSESAALISHYTKFAWTSVWPLQSPFSALTIYRKWLKQRNSRVDRSLSFANLVIHMNYKVSQKICIRCIFCSVIDKRMEWKI